MERILAAPLSIAVNDVVVDEAGDVAIFGAGGGGKYQTGIAASGLAGINQQQRAQQLPWRRKNVVRGLREKPRRLPQRLVHVLHEILQYSRAFVRQRGEATDILSSRNHSALQYRELPSVADSPYRPL